MDSRPYSRDDPYDSEAAEYPVIRTVRRPSVRSRQTSSSSNFGGLKSYLRSSSRNSIGSLHSPLQETEKTILSRSSSRRSVGSWVIRSPSPVKSLTEITTLVKVRTSSPVKAPMDSATSVRVRMSSLRTMSQETVEKREATVHNNAQTEMHATSVAPSLPATPQKQSEAETSLEPNRADISDTRGSVVPVNSVNSASGGNVVVLAETGPSRPRLSPRKSSIADAIPLRTSSLDRTPSPGQKSRSSKGKRAQRKPPVQISPDMFEGLDEEDETVKRIKQLRQLKESRLREEVSGAENSPAKPFPQTAGSVLSEAPTCRPRPEESTANSHLPKISPVFGKGEPSKSSAQTGRQAATVSPSSRKNQRHDAASPELNSPASPGSSAALSQSRNDKHRSPSFSLEHTHARTSGVLGELARDSSRTGTRVPELKSVNSRFLDGLDLDGLDVSPPGTSHMSHLRHSSNKNSGDWYLDLPTDLNKGRARRKSMSDARNDRALAEEILEERRNSVSDAVAEFLDDPRLHQTVRHPQTGRLISFSEVGDPNGAAVIVCVGMGLTRFISAFYDELATTLRLRLITPDRPGVGASEAYPDRDRVGPLGWPDDVLAITQHLRISKFSILAHSAGAVYALATALILPHCIHGKVQLMAPWIPPSQFEHYGAKDRSPDATPVGSLPRSQRLLRILPIPILKAANGGFLSPSSLKPGSVRKSPTSSPVQNPSPSGTPKKSKRRPDPLRRESLMLMDQVVVPEKPVKTMFPLPGLSEEDASALETTDRPTFDVSATATPTDPAFTFAADALSAAEHSERERQAAYSTLLTERTWTLATMNSNPAVDLLVCLERHRDIGFRYVDIQRQVVITHGSEDKRVSAENVRWIGEQMNKRAAVNWSPDAKEKRREMGGCEVRILPGEGHGLMASAAVMADVLTDIAGEWVGKR
ncbi:hypothetical protein MBLNU459_g6917t1 [Dothideomycetes sp. NU459]